MTQHAEALRNIIELDHHQHGPESKATEIARAAMQKAAEAEPGLDAFTIERCAERLDAVARVTTMDVAKTAFEEAAAIIRELKP